MTEETNSTRRATVNEADLVEIDRPYSVRFGDEWLLAVRRANGDVDFYGLPDGTNHGGAARGDEGTMAEWLRQAEADRDAYAAVAKAGRDLFIAYADGDRYDRELTDFAVQHLDDAAHAFRAALDALTDEQKERIT